MSDKLVEMFRKRYPLTPRGYDRIYTYPPNGSIERIHLHLVEKDFLKFLDKKKPLADISSIKNIAQEVFNDIGCKFYTLEEQGIDNIFSFYPKKMDDYNESYTGHFIEIREPLIIPKIMISTGNRGRIKLHDRQRKKYFQFINEVYDIFVQNSKKE